MYIIKRLFTKLSVLIICIKSSLIVCQAVLFKCVSYHSYIVAVVICAICKFSQVQQKSPKHFSLPEAWTRTCAGESGVGGAHFRGRRARLEGIDSDAKRVATAIKPSGEPMPEICFGMVYRPLRSNACGQLARFPGVHHP